MATTKQYVTRDQMVAGMNRGVKPHLLSPNQWRTQFNMRSFRGELSQVPRKKVWGNLCSEVGHNVLALVNLPVSRADYAFLLALTDTEAFRVEPLMNVSLLDEDGFKTRFHPTSEYARWSTCIYHGQVYFTNLTNPVQSCDGVTTRKLGTNIPSGKYVEHFYDHLLVGYPIYEGEEDAELVVWSAMHRFSEWKTQTFNEADRYPFGEHGHGMEGVRGVTGLGRLQDFCYVYTPSCIYVMQYVGLPKVFQTTPMKFNIGCGFQWGLVKAAGFHFFPDVNKNTFYQFDGQEAKDIGSAVMPYVLETISKDPLVGQRLYGYADYAFREIHWVYVSASATNKQFDSEVVYNWETGVWHAASVENVHCFSPGTRFPKAAVGLSGTAGELVGSAEQLVDTGVSVGRLYGSGNNFLLTEETTTDLSVDLLYQPPPMLETGDYYYEDLSTVKEIESMFIHAKYLEANGVDVFYASREFIDESLFWRYAGQWKQDLPERLLSTLRAEGGIFRFRFVPRSFVEPVTIMQEFAGACPTEGFVPSGGGGGGANGGGSSGGGGGEFPVPSECVSGLIQDYTFVLGASGQTTLQLQSSKGATFTLLSKCPQGYSFVGVTGLAEGETLMQPSPGVSIAAGNTVFRVCKTLADGTQECVDYCVMVPQCPPVAPPPPPPPVCTDGWTLISFSLINPEPGCVITYTGLALGMVVNPGWNMNGTYMTIDCPTLNTHISGNFWGLSAGLPSVTDSCTDANANATVTLDYVHSQVPTRGSFRLVFKCIRCAVKGRCCFPDGSCQLLSSADCGTAGGVYGGNGSVCSGIPCQRPGRCCYIDGHNGLPVCQNMTQVECLSYQGVYGGDGTTCDTPCPPPDSKGRCCVGTTCSEVTQAECLIAGGNYAGDGTNCVGNPCTPSTGRCCFPDLSCQVLSQESCEVQGGVWGGADTNCNGGPCQVVCCELPDLSCCFTTLADCLARGGHDELNCFGTCGFAGYCPP